VLGIFSKILNMLTNFVSSSLVHALSVRGHLSVPVRCHDLQTKRDWVVVKNISTFCC